MITISPVTPADIPSLHAMLCALCAFHGDRCMRDHAEIHAQFIDGPLTGLIAHAGDRAVGFATLVTHWRPMQAGDTIDILHLFVAQDRRGSGIGRKLIAAAKDHARASGALRLTIGTAPENPGAAAAYRAMGWEEITALPGPKFQMPL